MKRTLKKIFIVCLVALFGLVSCTDIEYQIEPKYDFTVSLIKEDTTSTTLVYETTTETDTVTITDFISQTDIITTVTDIISTTDVITTTDTPTDVQELTEVTTYQVDSTSTDKVIIQTDTTTSSDIKVDTESDFTVVTTETDTTNTDCLAEIIDNEPIDTPTDINELNTVSNTDETSITDIIEEPAPAVVYSVPVIHSHEWDKGSIIEEPSCTEDGVILYTCYTCSATYTDIISHTDHSLVHHDSKSASCTEDGYEAYDTCSKCSYSTYKVVNKLNHDIIHHDGKSAGCTEDGYEAYDTCSRCNYTTFQLISSTDHTYVTTTDKNNHWLECTECHDIKNSEQHTWDSGIVTTSPTCLEDGIILYTCTICGTTYTDSIGHTGHSIIHHDSKDPTFDSVGWKSYDTCSNCDYTTYEELPKLQRCGDNAWWIYDNQSKTLTIKGTGSLYVYMPSYFINLCGPAFSQAPWASVVTEVKKIVVESGITEIADGDFSDFCNVETIELPETVTKLGCYVCYKCYKLKNISIPSGVKVINYEAFRYCTSLESIILPEGLETINRFAFADCTSLKTITIPKTVTNLKDSALQGGTSMVSINVDSENPFYSSVDGVLFNKNGSVLINYPAGKSSGEYIVPDGTTVISEAAFINCSLKRIVVNDGCVSIGIAAFAENSNLEEVVIPASVGYVGIQAFRRCTKLTVTFLGTPEQWEKVNHDGDSFFI